MHLVIHFEVGHGSAAIDPVEAGIDGDDEPQPFGCFDADVSSILCKGIVDCHLLFFIGVNIKHLRLEIVITVAPEGCGYPIELCDLIRIGDRGSDLLLTALTHLGDRGNISGTFDAVHPVQLCQLRAGVAVKLVEVAEQGGKPLIAIPQNHDTVTDSRCILV